MYGKFEEKELKQYIGNGTLEVRSMKFELTQHMRDKYVRAPAPIWVHTVIGGNYIIHAIPYLNGFPLSLSIEYMDDPENGDERDISEREHKIGNASSEEPIRTFEEYKAQVKLLFEQILNDYTKMIEKQIKELKRD